MWLTINMSTELEKILPLLEPVTEYCSKIEKDFQTFFFFSASNSISRLASKLYCLKM